MKALRLLLLWLSVSSGLRPTPTARVRWAKAKLPPRSQRFSLFDGATNDPDMKGISGMKGYYRRPSRAIEKGGGFYVPGLEGERIRVITAAALVLMYIANRAGQRVATLPQIISELTGISVAILLFAQGAVDAFAGPDRTSNTQDNWQGAAASAAAFLSVSQSSLAPGSTRGIVVETLARSLVQTCPESNLVAVFGVDKVLFELGPVGGTPLSQDTASRILSSAVAPIKDSVAVLAYEDFARSLGSGASPGLPAGTNTVVLASRRLGSQEQVVWLLGTRATPADIDMTWLGALLSAPTP